MPRGIFLIFLIFFAVFPLFSQGAPHPYTFRGEVYVDFEPIYAGHVDDEYPLDIPAASRRALEEAALFFSAMVYGWTFNYEVGERARRIDEFLELEPIGTIQSGDSALKVTDTDIKNMRLHVWMDYHINDSQLRWIQVWRSGTFRNAQAVGYAPAHLEEYPGWLGVKKMALEDAARTALRTMLRTTERNRPKEVTGYISLVSFPRYFIDSGRWVASARFRVQITEIVPFSAY